MHRSSILLVPVMPTSACRKNHLEEHLQCEFERIKTPSRCRHLNVGTFVLAVSFHSTEDLLLCNKWIGRTLKGNALVSVVLSFSYSVFISGMRVGKRVICKED